MVPQFKPEVALAMFERMIKDIPFDQDQDSGSADGEL